MKLNITPQMQREAAIQSAKDYCKLMNDRNRYKDTTGNLRSSYGYAINGDALVVFKGMKPIYNVDLQHVESGNKDK